MQETNKTPKKKRDWSEQLIWIRIRNQKKKNQKIFPFEKVNFFVPQNELK